MTQTINQTTHATVGKSAKRKDAPDKLTGRTRYAGDLAFPRLVHARLVLSPYAHARIVSIDTAAAQAISGVLAVYTSEPLRTANAHRASRSHPPPAPGHLN